MDHGRYGLEAESSIMGRIAQPRERSFAEATKLPEAVGEERLVAGERCALTTFAQRVGPHWVMVTVRAARFSLPGLVSDHTERGLVFSREGSIRDATPEELRTSGGQTDAG